ncbi:MAG: exo-alpha-sialidase [Ruminococcaceae bacterium]|nr:exo-alpha-sialidase [Oscillospiraceae bacterium]
MIGHNLWSYAPYKPLLRNVGDIYICRIAPSENTIHFEWLDIGAEEYSVFYRPRNVGDFICYGKTKNTEFDIVNLETDTDYEFYIESGEKKSLIRLARTGKTVGTVVNYLHPDDEAYSFSGRYLCSPSLVRHPDGFLLASMDLFAGSHPQNLTLIFRSDDNGETWHYVSELMPCFWGKMFIHKGELYMLSCSTEYGDLLIGKSIDGGKTFSAPICLLRGANGKNGSSGVHKNPQNIFIHNGRLYNTLEWGAWANKEYCHAAMVMSCDINDDLLIPENWSFTEPKKFNPNEAPELSYLPECTMTIEGTLVMSPNSELLNVMRFGGNRSVIAYKVNKNNHEAVLEYSHCIPFPANLSKFTIKYDEKSNKYYSVASRLHEKIYTKRNLLSLMASEDLYNWHLVTDLLDYSNCDPEKIGFQYVDFEFEGDDIIFLCRTAINCARNYHDANYSTFHRIENFRRFI